MSPPCRDEADTGAQAAFRYRCRLGRGRRFSWSGRDLQIGEKHVTTLTLSTVAIILYGMVGKRGYGLTLALGGATAAGAALVAGSVAVPTFYATAIGAAVAVGLRLLGRGPAGSAARLPLPPGVSVLLLFLAWTALVTVVAPELFDGQHVLLPVAIENTHLTAGVISTSNIAQTIYLILGICVVVFLARTRVAGPELIGLAVGLTVLLSFWRYLNQVAGIPFPEGLFDNSPYFAYIETAEGGVKRFRGILTEPSSLAASCLVAISYMFARVRYVQGARRWGALVVAGIAIYLGTISTSAGFVVAAVVVVLAAGLTFVVSFLSRRASVSAAVSVISCVLVIVALWVLPIVADFVETTVNTKVGSSSFTDRSAANSESYDIFLDTYGFGVGLGSSRASSFFAGILSMTGIVGTLLFSAAVVVLIHRSAGQPEYRPVIWAVVTLLVLKIVSGPDLSDPSGVLWMSLGLLSRAALTAESRDGGSEGSPEKVPPPARVAGAVRPGTPS